MLEAKDFSFFESQNNFDLKNFFSKILGYWIWFLISLIIAFVTAYQVNIRKQKIYSVSNTVAYKEENNPFFTANTSLIFNWGGTSDQVQTLMTTIKSRSHNESVVRELDYYIEYLRQGKYNLEDAYGEVPYFIKTDKNYPQLTEKLIYLKFISNTEYEISIDFEEQSVNLYNYETDESSKTTVPKGVFKRKYKIGEQVRLPFLHWKLQLTKNPGLYNGTNHIVRLGNFNEIVKTYKGISIDTDNKAGAILNLSLQGNNVSRMVEYLNGTVSILINKKLKDKNQFATNTIQFIDSTLIAMESQLKNTEKELKDFRRDKNIFEVEKGGEKISESISELDIQKDKIKRKLSYYETLKNYLLNSVDYSKLPAATVSGIEDPNIILNVSKLTALSAERAELSYLVKNNKKFKDFDIQMEALKRVLLENISTAKVAIHYDLNQVNQKIAIAENSIKKLPEQQQELVKINRKYDLNKNIYNSFLEKRSEADIVRAANLSDIQFIDPAKVSDGSLIGPKTSVNYILALFLGILIPFIIVLIITISDNTIKNTEDITKMTKIPVLGIINKKNNESNLAVFEKQKSTLSESFRAIRSSLQFIYKRQEKSGAKTLMLTSSISGEGKTFCSINIATVFALSEKKTVLVGLDLRKPKIFEDFNLENNSGVVNYIIGQKSLEEITQKTHIPFLDCILSGPIPPNPSELLISEGLKELIENLKQKYDYIVLDTPPVGLVSDALELTPYCDATIYVVRQNVTKKDMLKLVNNKHKRGELNNISIILNGFVNKVKYGYGYDYGYGYGNYSNGYHEKEESNHPFVQKLKRIFKRSN